MNNMQKSFKRKSALRCMADGGAIYKSVGANGVPIFSDVASSGDPYTPGEQTPSLAPAPAPAPPPAARISPALPPPAAKISPLAIGPKSNLMANTGGFGPTPAPMSTYQKAGGAGTIGSTPSSIGANRAEIGANRTPIGAGRQPIGAMSPPIGANRAEIGANRTPIGAPRMGALGRPIMTSVGYASGGKVRGPGGPTEDKIPAMLSDGEYVLPADTVKKVGVQNLDALKDATHTPSGKSKLRGNVRKYAAGSTGGVKPMTDNELFQAQEQRRQNPQFYEQLPRPNVVPAFAPTQNAPPVDQFTRPSERETRIKDRLSNIASAAPVPYDRTGGVTMPSPAKLSVAPVNTQPFGGAASSFLRPHATTQELKARPESDVGGAMDSVGRMVLSPEGQRSVGIQPPANEIGPPSSLATMPEPAKLAIKTTPGGTSALPEGVTQRPDGIYQQGNSYSNIVGPDGKPQFLPQERMGPPSPAAEAYLARTPEMQFGPIPSGPGSSLRGGRGGGMRLNMPGASSGINARFDKMVSDYTKNANWGLSPSKTARTLAGIEQARTNALNGVMGDDTTRRGQDIDKARTDATNAAGMAQEGLKGQFNMLGEAAARNAAAQKAQAERDLEMETGTAGRLKALYGEDEGLGAHQAYTANQGLIQSMMTPGADGSINVREQDRMSGALHAVLKAAGKGPNSQIVDIVNIPDNNAEAGPTGSPIFDLTLGDAYEIKFANGEVARVKQSALKDTPDAESFLNQWQRRKAQQAKGAK